MLATDVWPALVSAYSGLINVAPPAAYLGVVNGVTMPSVALRGLSEGEQESVPESPWAWLMNGRGQMENEVGSDLAATRWNFNLRLMCEWAADPTNCERILMPIIEQVRAVHQFHLKLQTATVVFSILRDTDWGYIPINGVWYRSCDCTIEVREKEIRNSQA